ncbi:hypothetical protein P3T76_003139 [Phytophthora citrophthora]|uniref:Bacteriophage T5 Orf172 DNA-binding domain-containing protein n=1 Tax=Phytophthora citrophthora TaxID=4793 RepID=A0AAD9GWW0_9STRA|nr:hypothetical protein P3T76_003139 [Phytophthora citrophthora]
MFPFVVLLISDWYKNLFGKLSADHENKEKKNKEKEKKEKEVKFNGTPVEGVLYETPRAKTAGVYVLNCGATEKYQGLSKGPFFVMKVGRSDDIPYRIVKHNSSRGDFAVGGAKFLFGLEMTIEDSKKAERLLLAKLTQLGFARPIVTQFPARTTETFVFNCDGSPSHGRHAPWRPIRLLAYSLVVDARSRASSLDSNTAEFYLPSSCPVTSTQNLNH